MISTPDAPGRWEIDPATLVSGEEVCLELRYVNGETALPPGAWFRFDLEPLSVKSTTFCPMSEGLQIAAFRGNPPEVEIEPQPQTPHGFKPVRLVLPKGMLPRESFALRLGNLAENGELVALVMPSPVHNLAFNIWSGAAHEPGEIDWFELGWGASLPRCSIEAASASGLRIFAPSLVATGVPFTVKVAVTDAYDSAAHPAYEGTVRFEPGPDRLPGELSFSAADGCARTIAGVVISTPGVHRITAYLGDRAFESNPIVVRAEVDAPIRWGQLHGHDWHSECWGDGPDNYYRFGRDISGLDYLALSDHINTTPRSDNAVPHGRLYPYRTGERLSGRDAYLQNVRAAEAHHRPGSFVTLIGYEMSPYTPLHFNVFWPEATEENFERMFIDADGVFLAAAEPQLRDTNALVLPHMHATYVPYNNLAVGLNRFGEQLVPVVEGYSDWGMAFHPPEVQDEVIGGLTSDRGRAFYEWAGRGIRVGFVGDADTHTGLPGRRHPGSPSPVHLRSQGLTAARTQELSRHGIVDAYRSRSVYGTSGERIFLEVRAGAVRMGEVLVTTEPFVIQVEAAGTDVIERVGLYDPHGLVDERIVGDAREVSTEFQIAKPSLPETPYFIEVVQADHHRAWSSPIWVRDASLPNLAWERDADGLRLVNDGGGPAHDVKVAHHPAQHPFAAAAIPHPPREPGTPWAKVWTHRWDDHRLTVFFLWRDLDLDGVLSLDGFESYEIESEPIQIILAPVTDDDTGRIAFSSRIDNPEIARLTWGFNTTVVVSHRVPSHARLELATAIDVHVGEEIVNTTTLEVPLNGLTEPLNERTSIGHLAPGAYWTAPSAAGLWAADPDNEILERSESGNLYEGD